MGMQPNKLVLRFSTRRALYDDREGAGHYTLFDTEDGTPGTVGYCCPIVFSGDNLPLEEVMMMLQGAMTTLDAMMCDEPAAGEATDELTAARTNYRKSMSLVHDMKASAGAVR